MTARKPRHLILSLFVQQRAGGIDQRATGLYKASVLLQDLPLFVGKLGEHLLRQYPFNSRISSQGASSRTRNIGEDDIEPPRFFRAEHGLLLFWQYDANILGTAASRAFP